MFRLHAFGGCFLERDGRRLDAISGQRKALALLAVIATAGDGGVTRDTLLPYFWPESDEERARTSLRQLVHALRTQLHAPDLFLPSPELRLNDGIVTSDVTEFRHALLTGNLPAAVSLYAGPFLDGFYLKGADSFERWVTIERAALAHSSRRALEALAEQAESDGDPRAAVEWWRRLAAAEPLSARAAVGLMRSLDASGERAEALQHARAYELLVRDELGGVSDAAVSRFAAELRGRNRQSTGNVARARANPVAAVPHSETSAVPKRPLQATPEMPVVRSSPPFGRGSQVFALIFILVAVAAALAMWRRAPPTVAAGRDAARDSASPPGIPSIAVLPFVNTSGNPADESLSDGLTEELIGALAKVPGIKVTGRTSAFAFKARTIELRTIAGTLGVTSVLEGSVQRAGTRLKVNAQLVSAADGTVLWAEKYDRELRDLFAVQEEIARAIVGALRVKLARPDSLGLARRPTGDIRAYSLYLRGRHIFTTRTDRGAVLEASRYFEQALAYDSTFAEAYAGMSDVHTRLGVFGFVPPREAFARAKVAARRALAIDTTVAEAHTSLGHALCVADFDWRQAEREFRRAVSLNPAYTFARLPFAVCLMGEGRLAEAAAQLEMARATDPLAPAVSNLFGRLYVYMRQPDVAIQYLREALELSPQMDLAYQQLGHAYLQKGMPAEAVAALRRAAAISGPRDSAQLAYAYAVTGRRAEAEGIVRGLVGGRRRAALAFHIAMAYTGLGDTDRAFQWLETGYAERASFMVGVKVDPAFDALHNDIRWPGLLRKMGLEPGPAPPPKVK